MSADLRIPLACHILPAGEGFAVTPRKNAADVPTAFLLLLHARNQLPPPDSIFMP